MKNRMFWRLERIFTLIKGHDGIVRGAQLILSNGNKIERPVQKLYPLELVKEISTGKQRNANTRVEEPDRTRPKRHAAIMADERFKLIDQLENEN